MLRYKVLIMNIILIARVSDVEQRKALPAQKLRLKDYAEKELKQPYKYHEFDESAYKDDRRKFSALVDKISQQKDFSIVVFDKIDRFTRDASQSEVRKMGSLVEKGKIEMHFPSDNLKITKDSPATDLFRLGIGMLLAKYYSDASRDNVKRRFAQMLEDGEWIGAAPLGYLNVNEGTEKRPVKNIIVDPVRGKYIIKMFEMRATGLPYEEIAKQINSAGLRSKKGVRMNKSAVEKILNNPFYYGKMRYVGKEYPHKYEPLISYKLYMQCQGVRKDRHDVHTAYNSIPFAFKDNVKCGRCGCTVSCFYARNNVYLKCSGAKGKCGNPNTALKLVMPDMHKLFAGMPMTEDVVKKVIDELKKRHNNQQDFYTSRIDNVRAEYDQIKARLKALTYERLDGRITINLYDEIVTELTSRQQELDEELVKLTHSNKSFLVTISYLLDLSQRAPELFNGARERLQQKLLKIVLSNMVLNDKKLSYIVNDPYKTIVEENKRAFSGSNNSNWCG